MRVVVQPWERVLRYRDGAFVELLGPGRHRRRQRRASLVRLDVRPRLLLVPGQEVLTGDGLSVRLTLLARLELTDPRAWHEGVAAPLDVVYAAVQIAARHAVAVRTLDELLAARTELASELVSAVAAATADLGATVGDVTVKDLMIPAELRRVATELAMSRAQGLATLERARSEVAAVRALTNAAKMVSDNPALLQLRTLQAVEAGRATVVLTQQPYARGVVAGNVEPQSTL